MINTHELKVAQAGSGVPGLAFFLEVSAACSRWCLHTEAHSVHGCISLDSPVVPGHFPAYVFKVIFLHTVSSRGLAGDALISPFL